jgi:hypothetical protein
MRSLARQLDAELELRDEGGATVALSFAPKAAVPGKRKAKSRA